MDVKPSLEAAALRLRTDDDLLPDLQAAIDQAHAEALVYLDRPLHPDAAARLNAIAQAQAALTEAEASLNADAIAEATQALKVAKTGMVCTPDILAAQLLLADRLIGGNDGDEAERKEAAARRMLDLYAHRTL